jgi:DNA adenine methylase
LTPTNSSRDQLVLFALRGAIDSATRLALLDTTDRGRVLPFLKWPGGKRWIATRVATIARLYLRGRYYEPFLGGGAVFFALRPNRASLSDINGELIATYRTIRRNANGVVQLLKTFRVTSEAYYAVRGWAPRGSVQRAARFLYLNRTAFGGIYRLNRDGVFNVPFGGGKRTPAILWEERLVERAAVALRGVTLRECDFAEAMRRARRGDVVYCDPTYTVAHDNNGFVRYNERNFSWDDQERLAESAFAASRRGATVIVSNAFHDSVRLLYKRATVHTLQRASCVATSAEKRRHVRELLIIIKPNKLR